MHNVSIVLNTLYLVLSPLPLVGVLARMEYKSWNIDITGGTDKPVMHECLLETQGINKKFLSSISSPWQLQGREKPFIAY